MNLAASNIAWKKNEDEKMYRFLREKGFSGIEIAPTRFFEKEPYKKTEEAKEISDSLMKRYRLKICSMQSIWSGISQNIFKCKDDRDFLLNYTKSAIDFASAIDCQNLVFGCPKNRSFSGEIDGVEEIALNFFGEIGFYAEDRNVIFSIEANPECYNTNFINTTKQAIDFCKKLNNSAVKVNLDAGTMVYNEEDVNDICDNIHLINHIHISEPFLKKIEKRELHKKLFGLNYDKYISLEMNSENPLTEVMAAIEYMRELNEKV